MHGRRRAEHKALQRDPQIAAKLAKKASLWCQLQTELLQRRRDQNHSSETLELIDNALSVNPDPLWLWNFRREFFVVAVVAAESAAAVSGSSVTDDCFDWEREAAVTQNALENNPKAYGAWHHRKWSLCRQQQQLQVGVATTTTTTTSADDDDGSNIVLESELQLTASFLQRDERNFHCWSYRRFVVSLLLHGPVGMGVWQVLDENDGVANLMMGAQIGGSGGHHHSTNKEENHPPLLLPNNSAALSILEAEWLFTDEKIRDNFSNCSAIHYRSKLLVILHKDINVEMTTIVNNAICTEPDDQTAWWYQSFLLQYAAAGAAESSSASSGETGGGDNVASTRLLLDDKVLSEHIALLRELQAEMENQSKWVLLGLLNALSFQQRSDNSNETNVEEQRAILHRLATTVDPDRRMRYLLLLRDLEEQTKK
jgi:geranylgeranyl transferase type-2 subunit alpha